MKHHLPIGLLVCITILLTFQSSRAQTPKPQWQYVIVTQATPQGVPSTFWQEMNYASDKAGNTAIIAKVQDGSFNPIGTAILWISSSGKLLATIKVPSQPTILSVSSDTLYTTDVNAESDKNGNQYAIVKYSLNGTNMVRTPFGNDGASILSLIPGGGPLSIPPNPIYGVVLQKTSGTTNTFSFYHF